MDRILFPWAGSKSYPSVNDIYPPHESEIEKLINQWLYLEQIKSNWSVFIEDTPSINIFREESPANLLISEIFTSLPSIHPSWEEKSAQFWKNSIVENYNDVGARNPPENLIIRENASITDQLVSRFSNYLSQNKTARNFAITWKIHAPKIETIDVGKLEYLILTLWNGMRVLPYSNMQMIACLKEVLNTIYKETVTGIKVEKIACEFGVPGGAYSRANISKNAILEAMNDSWRKHLKPISDSNDVEFLLLHCFNPKIIFDFEKLVTLFATEADSSLKCN